MSGARLASAWRRRRPRTKTLDVRRTRLESPRRVRSPLAGEPRRRDLSASFEALGLGLAPKYARRPP